MPEEALINHRNLGNSNKTFWETRILLGIPCLKQSIIGWNVEHLSTLVTSGAGATLMPERAASVLLFNPACTPPATSLPDRATRASASKRPTFKSLQPHTKGKGLARKTSSRGRGSTALLIQFCVCSSLIYQQRHEPTSRCSSQSFQQCHLANSSGLQQLIF